MASAPEKTHVYTCPLCEAMCGLRITVRDGEVTRIRSNPDDVWSRGYICPKGTALGEVHHDPDRLRSPLVRRGNEWHEAGWDEAFEEVERRLHPVLERHGPSAVTAYIGNPTAHNFSLAHYVGAFTALSGLPVLYSAGTVDQWPKNLVTALMYGGMWTISTPDIDRTHHLMILGANPAASQGSLLATPDVMGRLAAIRRRGGKVVVVDPQRTGTAEKADEWIPIRPGTDAALLLAMIRVLFDEDLVQLGHLAGITQGVDRVEEASRDFPPEAVERTCGIPAARIRRLARELAAAPAASVYGRIGTCTQEFGTLASWGMEVLNVLTGNLDRPGGSMFSNPIAWPTTRLRPPEYAEGFELGRWRSRVRGAPEVLGQVPLSCLAEEIATPGEGRIRALITIAGNPVITAPEAARLDAALPELECMVSIDNWLNETTRHAHVILPGQSPLEQPHYDTLIWCWAVRNAAKYSPPIFPVPPGQPAEWEVLLKLAGITRGQKAGEVDVTALDDAFFTGLTALVAGLEGSRIAGRDPREIAAAARGRGPERLLDFALRVGPFGEGYGADPDGIRLEVLEQHPEGIDRGALEPRLAELLETPSGRVELAPDPITRDLDRLRRRLDRPEPGLCLVSRRDLRSNNSWMHNVPSLMKGKERCTLLIHPADAGRIGLASGGTARIRSAAGSLTAPVEITEAMMPGVVSLPYGWGHNREGTRLSVASRHPGVNNNLLAPGDLVDVPSGNAIVNGIPVEITPA